MIERKLVRTGNYITQNRTIDERPKNVRARVMDFFRDREAAKELLKLSRQVSDANGTLPSFSGRNSHQEPRNPQRPHDQEWTEADVWKGLSYWAWYPRFLTPLGLSISVPLLKVSYLTSKQVDNRVSNEKDESGRSIHTRYATTERGVGIVHIGRLVLGTTSRSTTRRINGHREKQDVSYSREITAYDTNAAQMIRDFRYAIENDQDSLPNRAKRKKAERKMRRSDRWYAVRHAHLREALKKRPYT